MTDRRRSCPGYCVWTDAKGTAEGTGASENVTGDAGNATMVDGDAAFRKLMQLHPTKMAKIAYNSLADDDSDRKLLVPRSDTVG